MYSYHPTAPPGPRPAGSEKYGSSEPKLEEKISDKKTLLEKLKEKIFG